MKYKDFVTRPSGAPDQDYIHPDYWVTKEEIRERAIEQTKKRRELMLEQLDREKKVAPEPATPKEIDLSQLRVGMKVKFKSWDRMVQQYGVDDSGMMYSLDVHFYTEGEEDFGREYTIKECEDSNLFVVEGYTYHRHFTHHCIAEIIQEPEPATPNPETTFHHHAEPGPPTLKSETTLQYHTEPRHIIIRGKTTFNYGSEPGQIKFAYEAECSVYSCVKCGHMIIITPGEQLPDECEICE